MPLNLHRQPRGSGTGPTALKHMELRHESHGLDTGGIRAAVPQSIASLARYNLRWDRNRWFWNGHWALSRAPAAGE